MAYNPNKFKTTATALASYDFQDIVNGTGVATYYAIRELDSSGEDVLSLQSENIESAGITSVVYIDIDTSYLEFPLTPFQSSRTATGTATLSFSAQQLSSYSTCTAKLQKVSGSTTTDISTEGVSFVDYSDSTVCVITMTITDTHFAQGDYLVLNIKSETNNMKLYTGAGTDKIVKLNVPFKIE